VAGVNLKNVNFVKILNNMIIGIDFDGTCTTHMYPIVGEDIGAIPVLRELINAGHQLILFTMRSKKEGMSPVTNKIEEGGLSDAVKWFKDNDIPLHGINTNPTQKYWTSSPKAYCHLYIDDAALGIPLIKPLKGRPFVDWIAVRKLLVRENIL
jgi:hypothetical protein